MYCKKCGNEIKEGSLFCDKCGERIDNEQNNVSNNKKGSINFDIKNVNFFGIIATLITIISVFLPCISVSLLGVTRDIKYVQGDGQFVLIVGVIAIVLALIGKKLVFVITGLIDFLIFLYLSTNLSNVYTSIINKGIGYYLLPIGAVLMIIAGLTELYGKKLNFSSIVDKLTALIKNNGKDNKKLLIKIGAGIAVILICIACIFFVSNLKNPGKFIKTNNNETQYKFKNGELANNEWVQHNKDEYYFDENGILQKSKWVDKNYYVDAEGKKMKNRFIEVDGNKYYLKDDGTYAKYEFVDVNGKTYAFNSEGVNIKNDTVKHASPSYICYVNDDGYVVKNKGINKIGNTTIFVTDESTGALKESEWYKDENSNKYMYFDNKGKQAKDKIVVSVEFDDGSVEYAIYNDYFKKVYETSDELGLAYSLSAVGKTKYYYVDENGEMFKNGKKEVDGYTWEFDEEGCGVMQLWDQDNYSDSNKMYIMNKNYLPGISKNTLSQKSNQCWLGLCVDADDVSLFMYEGESKRLIKNTLSFSTVDYNISLLCKSLPEAYRFTGTMYEKGDRIYLDSKSAKTTIENLLRTGEDILLIVREEDSYWDNEYWFLIYAGDFQKVYNETFMN